MSAAINDALFSFIRQSPTAFHAAEASLRELDGFELLQEHEPWHLKPGGRYVVTRNRSAVIAFTVPEGKVNGFQMVASHLDSPTFKIKEKAELVTAEKYVRLDVERYGGMIMSSWFDRPLSVAGRVLVRTEKGVETRLMNLDRDMVMIPNVAIHMNRDINNGYKYNAAVDVMPLWGEGAAAGSFLREIASAAGVHEEQVIGTDLYLYNRMPGTTWGENDAFISCGRLDDLECAFASIQAIKDIRQGQHMNVCCLMDNEEVGSCTKQGADSTFLYDVLHRAMLALGETEEDYQCALHNSMMLSADNAHATHPNHPELSDPINQVKMNGGVVVKFNANQKYTTDAVSLGVFRAICQHAGVPVQMYANRSDIAGGSTLGNIAGSHVSVNCVDIGLAQLAMHSCYETAGAQDLAHMIHAMRAFYETELRTEADGNYALTLPESHA